MAKIKDVQWEVWYVAGDVLGIKTCEAKPKYFAFNCGAELCKYMVDLHNSRKGFACDKSPETPSQDIRS